MRSRRADWLLAGFLAAISYIPLFLSRPGSVAADTKQYLYLDPGKLTTGAASMWDPNTGLGTVTHQNIGYLFPMGPYYTAIRWLGLPVWVGQRLWMGSLLLFAGLGVAYCARKLGLEGPGRVVAAAAYMLSPYTLDYLDRISAILLPWAALGWMVGLTVMAARTGRWKYPAAFALVVALVGGVNATSILLVLVAPALWLVHAVATREVDRRRGIVTAARIAGLSILVSVWWAAGLWAEGRYGINVLRVTETVPTVARTSAASEVLRGLGYWYFYGWDKVQPWTLQAVRYTQSPWLLGLSLVLPAISVALGLVTRWRYRSLAVAWIGLGTVIAVGAFPFAHPSLFGSVLKSGSSGSTVALALRSVDRIVPVVVLGLALLMGSGVTALQLRWSRVGVVAAAACVALVAADLPALWTGGMVASNLSRPSTLPAYWTQAAGYLNSQGSDSRVLGLPGEDFAAYAWGVTEDPVAPGLLDRPYVARQVVPAGTPAAANLVQALDEPIQEGTLDPTALAPIARLMSVGQILLQSDLEYERYHLPLPQYLWQELTSTTAGLGAPTLFGAPDPAPQIRYPLDSELRLGLPADDPQPAALAVFNVTDPRALVRTESAQAPIILAGDGNGLVEAAGAGLLSGDPLILYSASLARSPQQFDEAMSAGAALVVTDTNALALGRWGGLRDNAGQVEQVGVVDPSAAPGDYSLPVFPGEGTDSQTVAEVNGVASVTASAYGDSLAFTPENRPVNAVDGDVSTAWTFGAHSPVAGGWIKVNLDAPVTTNQITLTQAQLERPNRRITSVTLRFDGGNPLTVPLTSASYSTPGQVITFPTRAFRQLEVVVDSAGSAKDKEYDGLSQVGFAEIGIPGVTASETLRLPTDLLSMAGSASLQHPLVLLMQRSRAIEPPRHDPELDLSRTFTLPTSRTFSVGGTAEINAGDSDYLINQLIGLTPPPSGSTASAEPTVVAANSSTRLDGDRQARANAAVDGNPATAWIAETGPQAGEWLSVDLSRPVTFGHLDLQVVNDGRHSLPTTLTITTENGSRTVTVPSVAIGTGRAQGATSSVPVTFAPISGQHLKVTIDSIEAVRALDYYSTFAGTTDILPVGIAELGLPGIRQPVAPPQLPTQCQAGLLTIDGHAVDVEVAGPTADALAGHQIALRACGNSTAGVTLGPGPHTVQTSPRLPSGWSIDQLWFESDAGGGPAAAAVQTAAAPPPPALYVDHQDRTSADVTVTADGQGFWLVLGQSYSAGWSASAAGKSLGAPTLVDGYANGWYVPAGRLSGTAVIHLTWTPQRVIWAALALSAAAILACLLVAVWPTPAGGRRRRTPSVPAPSPAAWAALVARGGRNPGWRVVAVAAVAWGLVSAAVSRPAVGAVAAAAVLLGTAWSGGRLTVRLASVAALVSVAAYDVQQQVSHRYLPTIDWPAALSAANDLAWLGLLLLGADVVAGLARSGRPAPSRLGPGKD